MRAEYLNDYGIYGRGQMMEQMMIFVFFALSHFYIVFFPCHSQVQAFSFDVKIED